jgi:hypothetical protein
MNYFRTNRFPILHQNPQLVKSFGQIGNFVFEICSGCLRLKNFSSAGVKQIVAFDF